MRVLPVSMLSDAAVHLSDSTASVSLDTGASDAKTFMITVQDVLVRMMEPAPIL